MLNDWPALTNSTLFLLSLEPLDPLLPGESGATATMELGANRDLDLSLENNEISSCSFSITAGELRAGGADEGGGGGGDDFLPQFDNGAILSLYPAAEPYLSSSSGNSSV